MDSRGLGQTHGSGSFVAVYYLAALLGRGLCRPHCSKSRGPVNVLAAPFEITADELLNK